MLKIIEAPVSWLEKFGVNGGIVLMGIGLGALVLIFTVIEIPYNRTFGFLFATAPIWLPIITFLLFFEHWMYYVRKKYSLLQGRVTLEIKLPQDVFKSPEAMELILVQLHQTASPDNHLQTYLDGKHPPTTSLEIVSRGGDVRFYMNVVRKKFKNIAEAALYSQYPGIEIKEMPIDYTAEIPWDPSQYEYFSVHFGLKKPDAYPIKTYYEYGLHTMPKEEEKIDPITLFIDTLANLGPGEYFWTQILIDANREVTFKEGGLTKAPDWKVDARKEIQKIIDTAKKRSEGEPGGNVLQLLTDGERDTIKAIERSLGKNAFNAAIRGMYIGKSEHFLPGERIGAMITAWRGYDDINRNAIGVRWRTDFNWNQWQDPSGKKKQAMKKTEFHQYKTRTYQPQDMDSDTKKVMTTEELATIFHFPGKVATTPTMERIPSVRGEAPSNLPVGE